MKKNDGAKGGFFRFAAFLQWVGLALVLALPGAASAFTFGTPTTTVSGPVVKIASPVGGATLTSAKVDVLGTVAGVGGGQGIDMVIVVDDSGSLSTSDPTKERFAALQALLNNISTGSDIKLGLVFFAGSAQLEVPLDTAANATKAINTAISSHATPNGGTATDLAIKAAATELNANGRSNASKVILLFTDGAPNSDSAAISEATSAKAAGITVNVVQLGQSGGSNPQVAGAGGGQVLAASTPQELVTLFSSAKIVNIASVSVTNTTTGKAASNLVMGAGGYAASVELNAGQNVISVTATDTAGLSTTQTVTVTQQSAPVATVTLKSLLVSGASSLKAGDSTSFSATAVYSDGTTKTVTPTWSATGSGASIGSNGTLTADANLTNDTPVTITAIYVDGGETKVGNLSVMVKANSTATPTTTATGCTGASSSLASLSLPGASFRKLGESLDVGYCLKNFNSATKFDIYIAVQLPDGTMLFMQSAGFFGTPSFSNKVVPYLGNTLIPDKSGTVLSIPTLPMELGTGTYTFYAVQVLAGKDVMNGFNWIGQVSQVGVTLGR